MMKLPLVRPRMSAFFTAFTMVFERMDKIQHMLFGGREFLG